MNNVLDDRGFQANRSGLAEDTPPADPEHGQALMKLPHGRARPL